MFRSTALLALTGLACAAIADPVDWIAGTKHTYIVLPPQSITDGAVKAAAYSSDGAYLLVGERPLIPDQERALQIGKIDQAGSRESSLSLLIWDRLHRQTKSDWTTEDPTVGIDSVHWIHGTPTAVIVMHSTIHTGPVNKASKVWAVMALNAATGRFEWVSGLESLTFEPTVTVSPTKPTAVITFSDVTEEQTGATSATNELARHFEVYLSVEGQVQAGRLRLSDLLTKSIRANNFIDLDGSGRPTRRVHAQPPIDNNLVWNSDGSLWLLAVGASKDNASGLARLDDNGKLIRVAESQFKYLPESQDLGIEVSSQVAKRGKTEVSFNQDWLVGGGKSDHSELLLTPNGEQPSLSPATDSVYYIEGGVAKVRLVLILPADASQALRDAEKVRAQSRLDGTSVLFDGGQFRRVTNLKIVFTAAAAPPDKP